MTSIEIDNLFSRVDIDKSNEIDYSEFVMAAMDKQDILSKDNLQAAFKMLDKDGGGTLSFDEIK